MNRWIESAITILVSLALLAAAAHGCSGCVLIAPEGDASFWSLAQ